MTFEEILKLVLKIEGEKDARALSDAIKQTGKEAGVSEKELSGLVDEINKIGRAKEAAKSLQEVARAQEELGDSADRAGLRLRLATESQQSAADANQQAIKALEEARQAQADYAAGQEKTKEGTQQYAAAVRDAAAAQKAAKAELASADATLKSASRDYERVADAQARAAKEASDLQKVLVDTGANTKDLATTQKVLAERSEEVEKKLAKLRDVADAGASVGAELSDRLKDIAKEEAKLATSSENAAQSMGDQVKSADRLDKATKGLGDRLKSAREAVSSFGSNLLRITGIAGAVSAALGALSVTRIFGGAISSARTFESVLSEVQAVSGATADQLDRMRDASEQASATTKFTAEEAAAALGELARASGDADAAIAQLPPTLNLAQAGGLDAARSAEILTTALTQFGLEATDAARVADLFTREANSTQDTVEKLGLAMSYVAPLARQFGMSIEDATALLGALAEQGFRGERAGTALRNVFSALLDPSSKFSRALRTLGIDGNDFIGVISQLSAAGDEGRKAILALDAEARPAILALVKSGGEGIRRLQEDFRGAAGEAERTAQAIGANFEGASNRFTSALDFLRRSLVDPILEPLAREFDTAATRIRAFVETADFKALAASIRDFAASAARAISDFVRGVDFGAVVQKFQDFTRSASDFFSGIGEKASSLQSTLRAVGNGISLFWNGAQTVILGAAAVASRGVQLFAGSMLFMAKAVAQATGTLPALRTFFDEMEVKYKALGAVTDEFARRTEKNAGETVGAFKGLVSALSGAGDAAKSFIGRFAGLGAAIREGGDAAKNAASTLDSYSGSTRSATDAARESEQAHINQQAALIAARESVRALKDQLLELVKSGKGSADEMQRLQNAIAAAEAEVRKLTPSAKNAAEAAQQLRNAFADLGVTSQEELRKTADLARSSFDTIVSAYRSGQAAIEDVIRSFAAYAEAERAASDASSASEQARVESLLASKAAALGLTAELERAGVIGQKAGNDTAEAMRGARDAIEDTAAAAGEMAAQQTRVVEQVQATNNQIIIQTQLTDEQRRALVYLGQQWDAGRLSAEDYGRELQEVMSGGTEAIERQIEAAERARDALRDLTNELRDEADRAAGNEADIERRRYQEQLDRIKELEEAGGAAARREALEARRLAEEEHRRRMEEIRTEERARRDARRGGDDAASAPAPTGGGGGGGGSNSGGSNAQRPINVTLILEAGAYTDTSALTRDIAQRLTDLHRRGGFL